MVVLLGISLIIFGALIIYNPVFYDRIYDYYFDLRGYNIPLGIAMIILGVAFIWTEIKNKLKKRK